jgi:serine/threonine protein kinase
MAIETGPTLSHYRLIEKIGEGGMGSVWKALDTRLDREVALKVLPERVADDPKALARFEREARAVAALFHPHILAVHDVGSDNGVHFVVMELLEGETLRQRLAEGPLSVRKTVDFAAQIARGLAAAHDKGIVHRDSQCCAALFQYRKREMGPRFHNSEHLCNLAIRVQGSGCGYESPAPVVEGGPWLPARHVPARSRRGNASAVIAGRPFI